MSATLEALSQNLQQHLGDRVKSLKVALGEVTIEVDAADYLSSCRPARRARAWAFEELIDLCGVDYSTYGNEPREGRASPPSVTCCRSPRTGACAFAVLRLMTISLRCLR
jgi:NADH:ubiquinone oxidoreductase subunit C